MTKPTARPRLAVTLAYSPHRPQTRQHAFIYLDELGILEALYGGAAGGGKSDALLMAALRYVHIPGYSALLLRRTYPELAQADGLMYRAEDWLAGTDARYNATEHYWTFPSGARLSFGYLASRNDRLRYQGGAYQFVGFDELTQFRELDYRYLLSRIRRPDAIAGDNPLGHVPLRMRAASNPGGPGHDWVKRRFVDRLPDPEDPDDTPELAQRRIFIPAKLADNRYLDQAAYRASLAGLPPRERAQLLDGDWNVDTGDRVYPPNHVRAVLHLGHELDELARAGTLPPPAEPIALGIDFGEWTHGLLGYPLEGGGMYVRAGIELTATEPGVATERIIELADTLPEWSGRRELADRLRHIGEARYDPGSAGAQSVRTFAKVARLRHARLKTVAIPFGEYKREAMGHLAWLMEGADLVLNGAPEAAGRPILAIGAGAPQLRRQLPAYRKNPATGDPVKEDDHGPDALVALIAPVARRYRDRGAAQRATAHARAARRAKLPTP